MASPTTPSSAPSLGAKRPRDRVERPDAEQGHAKPVREPLRRRDPDPHAREGARVPGRIRPRRCSRQAPALLSQHRLDDRQASVVIAARGAHTVRRRTSSSCPVSRRPTPQRKRLRRGVEREDDRCSCDTPSARPAASTHAPASSRRAGRRPQDRELPRRSSPVMQIETVKVVGGKRFREAVAPLDGGHAFGLERPPRSRCRRAASALSSR